LCSSPLGQRGSKVGDDLFIAACEDIGDQACGDGQDEVVLFGTSHSVSSFSTIQAMAVP
jgi:hypothetical protein